MATGFEHYVITMDDNPAGALALARQHLQKLMEIKMPRVGEAGASHDSTAIDSDIERTRTDIDQLRRRVYGYGRPQLVPCRRAW